LTIRHTTGSDVPTIAIFRISPNINGVNPALIVQIQSLPVKWCNQRRPKVKIVILPINIVGRAVKNF
jgi:hypothetical protein